MTESGRDNDFDAIRLLSGFLIATSWARSPLVLPFLTRRVFRIFPALIVVVLFSVFVLGPALTTLPIATYAANPATWGYLLNLTLVAVYPLPGVFLTNPVDTVVNGSLWTLGPEFLCYLGVIPVGLVALIGGARRPDLRRLALFVGLGVALVVLQMVPDAVPTGSVDVLRVTVFLAGGATIAELDRLGWFAPARRIGILLPVAGVWVVVATVVPGAAASLAWLVLPYVVIGLGSRSTPVVRRAARFGDLSYGLYLWGFPVQQTATLLAPGLPLAVDILIVGVVALLVALLSWRLVERRAIDFGRRLSERLRMMRSKVAAS